MKKMVLFILLLGMAGAGYWLFLQHKKAPIREEEKSRLPTTTTVERKTLRRTVESTGEVRPENRLEVTPPIPGRIEELMVREGDEVRRGEIIAWISSTERASLLDIARAKGEEEVRYWEEIYKATPLISPLDGTVIVRALEPGQAVTASSVMVVIADRLIVVGLVDETDIGAVFPGQRVQVRLDAYPRTTFEGAVKSIAYDSRLVSNVTMYEVHVMPDDIPDFSRSGMTATLNFLVEERKNVPVVPTAALQYRDQRPYVLVPGPDGAEPQTRWVKSGLSENAYTEILEGLLVGETVLVPQIVRPSGRSAVNNPFMPGTAVRGGGSGRGR